jgi:hypothetical protein
VMPGGAATTRRASAVALVAVVMLTAAVSAHSPYERVERTLTDESGREFHLVKAFTDGIFMADPVKLILRDSGGTVLAETEYGRDVSVLCPNLRGCFAFRYDGLLFPWPPEIWRVEGPRLVRTTALWLWPVGVLLPLRDHSIEYLVALALLLVALAPFRVASSVPPGGLGGLVAVAIGLLGILLLFAWLYFVLLLSYLSLPHVALLIAAAIVCYRAIRRNVWPKGPTAKPSTSL